MKIKELRHELYELLIFINEYYLDEDDVSSTNIVFKIFNITDKC